ncbi:MAG: hypothetical protein NC084_03400 [Bacteroides sp.]|nr:hypothetical protein [Eubacterium sp.]MCM1419070.1 hypothetical protein [Roseburia sp.]MCM1461743.1 hypothetical protein [Bacteroides sp.]
MDERMDGIVSEREGRADTRNGKASPKKAKPVYGALEYIAITFLVTHAFSSLLFEERMTGVPIEIYRALLTLSCIAAWLWCSFRCGTRGKWGFLIYAGAFWILPQIASWLANEGPEAFRFSLTMYLFSELSLYYSTAPLEKLFGWLTGNTMVSCFVAFAVCGGAYACGWLAKRGRKGSLKK